MAEAVLAQFTAQNMYDLRGVIAVITGGGTGLGLMMATTLVANGVDVYIIGIANTFNDAAEKIPGRGSIYGIEGDIRSKSEATRLAAEVGARAGHVTMLFHNVGITVGRVREHEWVDKGRADLGGGGAAFPYLFSKCAIGHATASVAHELLPLGIRVNAIAPGLFPSEITGPGTSDALGNPRVTVDVDFRIPAAEEPGGSIGTNKDIGSVALMLAANRFMNGSVILVDGATMLVHPNSF